MEKFRKQIDKIERPSTIALAAITAISMFIVSSCKVMLPDGKVMSRTEYIKKRDAARKKCEHLLPKSFKNADFEDIYCNPCTSEFKSCFDKNFNMDINFGK